MKLARLSILLVLALGSAFAGINGKKTWSYHLDSSTGPEKWAVLYPTQCGPEKTHQSPIDIIPNMADFSEDLDAIDLIDGTAARAQPETKPEPETEGEMNGKADVEVDEENTAEQGEHAGHDMGGHKRESAPPESTESGERFARKMSLFNNGHTAQLDVEEGDVFLMSKALGKQYKVAQLHFHWGKNGSAGSEHRINGEMYHLEMHIVAFDSESYSSVFDAVGTHHGIAAFGVLFKKGKHNKNLNNVVSKLKNITRPRGREGKVDVDWFDIEDMLPASLHKYYRYDGSLTTPQCDETVQWTIFEEHPTVCPSQLKEFYTLREGRRADGEPVQLENNYRRPQPLNGRNVLASFVAGEKGVEYNVVQGEAGSVNAAPSLQYAFTSVLLCLCITRKLLLLLRS